MSDDKREKLHSIDYGKTELGELHEALIDILREFVSFCDKHDLKYYAYGGTLLGAIRHEDIIPWDDDIDIGMFRDDYNKLLDLIKEGACTSDSKYQFVNAGNDKYFNKAFTRLSNNETTEIAIVDASFKYNRGCFIDIIPMDYVPAKTFEKLIYIVRCRAYIYFIRACSRYTNGLSAKNWKLSKRIAYYAVTPLFRVRAITTPKLFYSFNSYLSKQKNSDMVGNSTIVPGNERWTFRKKWFQESEKRKFGNLTIAVPKMFDEVLSKLYGDYMTPIIEPPTHGETIFDINTPYKMFVKQHEGELNEIFESKMR